MRTADDSPITLHTNSVIIYVRVHIYWNTNPLRSKDGFIGSLSLIIFFYLFIYFYLKVLATVLSMEVASSHYNRDYLQKDWYQQLAAYLSSTVANYPVYMCTAAP